MLGGQTTTPNNNQATSIAYRADRRATHALNNTRHWNGLQLFLADGRVEMDSNSVDNFARPIAYREKSALFAGHDEGAAAWGRIASLIETINPNRVEPYAWLKAALEAIAVGHPNSRIDELPPLELGTSSLRQAEIRVLHPHRLQLIENPHFSCATLPAAPVGVPLA